MQIGSTKSNKECQLPKRTYICFEVAATAYLVRSRSTKRTTVAYDRVNESLRSIIILVSAERSIKILEGNILIILVAINEECRVASRLLAHNSIKGKVRESRMYGEPPILIPYKVIDILGKGNLTLAGVIKVSVAVGKERQEG